jgi:hypothetical protein
MKVPRIPSRTEAPQPLAELRSLEDHRFNTDLLINPGDSDCAAAAFPRLRHVLSHTALQEAFTRFDRLANTAKRKGRITGLLAIALGIASLMIAAATPKLQVLGFVAAVCGVSSIAIGLGGVLYAGAKRRWLCNRLMTERLRQFHFQAFVCRWREISVSLAEPEAGASFEAQREVWFNRFMGSLAGQVDAELTDLLDDDTAAKCWLHPQSRLPDADEEVSNLMELFAAYRAMRIMHQLHYANHKLRAGQNLFAWSPRLQDLIFSYTTLVCILLIFGIHMWIALSIAIGTHISSLDPVLFHFESAGNGIDVHIVVIWTAIVALGFRALQEGLQPEREIERYQHYRAGVRAVRDRFDISVSPAEKLEVMQEMERLVFDELRNFLRSNHDARFII